MSKKVVLSCSQCLNRNYNIHKSNDTKRFFINKFCRKCNKQTQHQEEK